MKDDLKGYMFKEVEIIQSIIRRMASNSFLVKGWTITLVAVTLLFKGTRYHVFIAFIPLIAFWYLDAYFLWQERLYRKLYEWVINNRLKTDQYLLDMNAYRFRDEVESVPRIMRSLTLGLFYGLLGMLTVIYIIVLILV